MLRDVVISKTLLRLGFGLKGTIPEKQLEEFMSEFKTLFKKMEQQHRDPKKQSDEELQKDMCREFLRYFDNIIKKNSYEKEQVQEILAKAKSVNLINKSMVSNKYMERAWRSILNIHDLRGFILGS